MTFPRSAYLHIPFCRRRCFYCDFPVAVVGDKVPLGTGDRINGSNSKTIAHYVEVLCQEIQQTPKSGQPLATVFFGGGTPSLLSVEQLAQILTVLEQQFGLEAAAELSMEIDPATFDLAQLAGYKAAGINRVSLGVQAFQGHLLQAAGRSHTVADIEAAIAVVQAVGVTNLSLDLISGLPHQTLADWVESLERAIALGPTHLSCYDLIVEAGTPFSRQYQPGCQPLPSDELTAEMYRTAHHLLTAHGFEHYEISNYAKPGYHCRHNRTYWENRPFYGFGMGATSFVNGDRVARPRKTHDYYAWVAGLAHSPAASAIAPPPDLLETLMLGLRLAEGVDLEALTQTFGADAIATVLTSLQPFIERQWVSPPTTTDRRLCLTAPDGFLFSNTILTALFQALD